MSITLQTTAAIQVRGQPAHQIDIHGLHRELVQARCHISDLYSKLLLSQPLIDTKLLCAAHDWTLSSISTISQDLLTRIPNGQKPINPYSNYFSYMDDNIRTVVEQLNKQLTYHQHIATKIEQFGKGVL